VTEAPEVIVRREGAMGRLSLNRPAALHSLSIGMCHEMTRVLLDWKDDPAVEFVMIDHAEGRGFCAGGDIRYLVDSVAIDGVDADRFFHDEYQLDHLLFTYPKPVIALIDGVVMGGGVGISAPAPYRIATERTTFAMPECGIGLIPDVGGGWYLPRLPGRTGLWLALTGSRIKAADCLHVGIATHYITSDKLEALKLALAVAPASKLGSIIESFSSDPGPAPIEAIEVEINSAFAGDDLHALVAGLRPGSDWAKAQVATMAAKCPMMLACAHRQYLEGARAQHFRDVLAMEYRLCTRCVRRPDFTEGVRATVIDKDGLPKWSPASLDGITPDALEAMFAPLTDKKEWTPLPQAEGADDTKWRTA